MRTERNERHSDLVICLALAVAVLAGYAPLWNAGFTNYDDTYYVTHNPHVNVGITLPGLKWASTDVTNANWHPLTWLSHMLDCQLFGLNSRGHHLTSILLHAANTVLLFILLRRLTGAYWASAGVAGLFGLHPLHVESVAWIAERKDVLSGLFFILTLMAYAAYTRRKFEIRNPKFETNSKSEESKPLASGPTPTVLSSKFEIQSSKFFYWTALLCFALGLMSKPMLVTTPFVLLLLDAWPLGRLRIGARPLTPALSPSEGEKENPPPTAKSPESSEITQHELGLPGWRGIILEKLPFFALAGIISAITYVAQKSGGAMPSMEQMSMSARLANALHSYAAYVGKLFLPTDLAVIYPLVPHWPPIKIIVSAAFVIGVSSFVWAERRPRPFLLVGWCWFLGMLVPVIGLVQVGNQSMADRYTYLPSIGIFLMVVWTIREFVSKRSTMEKPIIGLSTCLLCGLGAVTWVQNGYWKNSETLFKHAVRVTRNNYIAYNSLGFDALDRNDLSRAKEYFEAAVSANPASDIAWAQLGAIAVERNDLASGSNACVHALELNPRNAGALATLGLIDSKSGRLDEAIAKYRAAIQLKPSLWSAHFKLAAALARQGEVTDALAEFEEVVRFDPKSADARNNLGFVLLRSGRAEEAIEQFRAALELQPGLWQARFGLGNALEKAGRHEEAATELNALRQEHPEVFRK